MEINNEEVLTNVVSYLENERDNTLLDANQNMEQNNDAAKIAIAKLLLIADIIKMLENVLQSNVED
jgi:predicted nucleic-acid-binding protein